ncbi:CDT1-like protein a, chloroplastic [Prosopis cineraria]|uniref:CDT1-like protein a, chloroplastic n=1 Tax=Prosopis cineraria TaxID=364024 RepID=UPI00240F5E18|nr:CDT1-like protein a, chloroplastic [Prosopis cineraria]
MSSSDAKPIPFKSKKPRICHSASKSQSPDPISLSSKTPEKASRLSHRSRNRGVALSIREVRKVAESLQEQKGQQQNHDRTEQIKSARGKIAPSFAEVTPRKSKASVDESVKLPEKYEILGEFFDSLDSSIRLLHLKGSTTTFTNICPKIECLTDRRFTHSHLAQLKYILPEALVIKKVLRLDERTSCMKPDLYVTINRDAKESDSKLLSEGGSVSLRKLFRTRLRDFYKSHPEVDEIPEEILPVPFNHHKQDHSSETLRTTPSFATITPNNAVAHHYQTAAPVCMQDNAMGINSEPAKGEENSSVPVNMSIEAHHRQPAAATHMSQSFRRRFSHKSVKDEADDAQQKSPSGSCSFPQSVPVAESIMKKNSSSVDSTMGPQICASPANLKSSDASVATPNKVASTPSRLMTLTPSLPTPKRCYMSPDDSSYSSPDKLVRRSTSLKKSLNFDTPVKNRRAGNETDFTCGISTDDVFDTLPESLLQSIKEKERVTMEERNPAIAQAKRRQKMIASLPKLFNMIHLLIHSMNRSVVTKEELLSKIISNHCDIVDRREVEEQLNLLLELVPEWISEKLASSGDLLFCINKMQNPETIRSQLAEAK